MPDALLPWINAAATITYLVLVYRSVRALLRRLQPDLATRKLLGWVVVIANVILGLYVIEPVTSLLPPLASRTALYLWGFGMLAAYFAVLASITDQS